VLSDIEQARIDAVASEIAQLAPAVVVASAGMSADAWAAASLEADLVIQATPIGMKVDDKPLLGAGAFRPGQFLFDLIYMFPNTGIMTEAGKAGATTANGLGMLLHQGARSFEIWTGRQPAIEAMRAALEQAVYSV